jgi:hypothetical protein
MMTQSTAVAADGRFSGTGTGRNSAAIAPLVPLVSVVIALTIAGLSVKIRIRQSLPNVGVSTELWIF